MMATVGRESRSKPCWRASAGGQQNCLESFARPTSDTGRLEVGRFSVEAGEVEEVDVASAAGSSHRARAACGLAAGTSSSTLPQRQR